MLHVIGSLVDTVPKTQGVDDEASGVVRSLAYICIDSLSHVKTISLYIYVYIYILFYVYLDYLYMHSILYLCILS